MNDIASKSTQIASQATFPTQLLEHLEISLSIVRRHKTAPCVGSQFLRRIRPKRTRMPINDPTARLDHVQSVAGQPLSVATIFGCNAVIRRNWVTTRQAQVNVEILTAFKINVEAAGFTQQAGIV